jgi:hypothetical protein
MLFHKFWFQYCVKERLYGCTSNIRFDDTNVRQGFGIAPVHITMTTNIDEISLKLYDFTAVWFLQCRM